MRSLFHHNAGSRLGSYSRVTTETASPLAKSKLPPGFCWEIAKEKDGGVEKITPGSATTCENRGRASLLSPLLPGWGLEKPAPTSLTKSEQVAALFSASLAAWRADAAAAPSPSPNYSKHASAARAAPPRARLQAEKSEVEVKAHTDLMSASDFK